MFKLQVALLKTSKLIKKKTYYLYFSQKKKNLHAKFKFLEKILPNLKLNFQALNKRIKKNNHFLE